MSKDDGEERIVALLMEARKPMTKDTLAGFARAVREAEGEVVSAAQDPWDGDWCGTGVKFKWPPKRLDGFLDFVVRHHGIIEVFPLGIPVPHDVLVRVKGMSNRIG
ncbi:MAG: hypothetical protein H6709_14700 [Kofleriaceae bacterium]|nr:hypothetical protein [Kofleriaceae bacterium]MCB9573328.1 hypothetical protein [Kofleriaceae bacterium]